MSVEYEIKFVENISFLDLYNELKAHLCQNVHTAHDALQVEAFQQVEDIISSIHMYFKLNYPRVRTLVMRETFDIQYMAQYKIYIGNAWLTVHLTSNSGLQCRLLSAVFTTDSIQNNLFKQVVLRILNQPRVQLDEIRYGDGYGNMLNEEFRHFVTHFEFDTSPSNLCPDRYRDLDSYFIDVWEMLY